MRYNYIKLHSVYFLFALLCLVVFLCIYRLLPDQSVTPKTTIYVLHNGHYAFDQGALLRACPSFDCAITKWGAIYPVTEVVDHSADGDWYSVLLDDPLLKNDETWISKNNFN